ncbi:MAG: ZIP family metal transporter [Bacteroidia bacterium]
MGLILPVLILIIGPLTGIILQKVLKVHSHKMISYTVVFSGSFLMGIALFGLMPELFDNISEAGVWIVCGFLFQVVLERFTGGLGHGHIHSNDVPKSELVLFSGLMIHALLEGYSAGLSNYLNPGVLSGMVIGISIHEVPAAFSLSVLMGSKWKRSSFVFLFLFLYVIATPIGYVSGVFVHNESIISEHMSQVITAIIAGTFLHISTTIVFENSIRKKGGFGKLILIVAGLAVSYLACIVG